MNILAFLGYDLAASRPIRKVIHVPTPYQGYAWDIAREDSPGATERVYLRHLCTQRREPTGCFDLVWYGAYAPISLAFVWQLRLPEYPHYLLEAQCLR